MPTERVNNVLGEHAAPVLATLFIHDVSTGLDGGRLRRPLVVMVEPTEDRKPDDVSTDLRNRP